LFNLNILEKYGRLKWLGKEKLVALKKILTDNEKEGFPFTALREMKILQMLNHENNVRLIEVCISKRKFFLVSYLNRK
jgi:serine/threonine protein kinase